LPTERKTILVVDDDVELRTTLRIALENEGFAFDSAGNGLAALQKVRERAPDLVILDLNMPRMGGEEFLYAWRAGVETPGVPVIVITATSDALKPTDFGVQAVLPKPFDVDKLLGYVSDLLSAPPQSPRGASGSEPQTELRGVLDDLAEVTSVVLMSAEAMAVSPGLSEDARRLASMGLDAAQRASALVRRLAHLARPLE